MLNQFGRSAFQKYAAELRIAVDGNDQNGIQKALDDLVRMYHISSTDVPDERTRFALGEMALGKFVEGFGYGEKTNPYYQMFLAREREQRNA